MTDSLLIDWAVDYGRDNFVRASPLEKREQSP